MAAANGTYSRSDRFLTAAVLICFLNETRKCVAGRTIIPVAGKP